MKIALVAGHQGSYSWQSMVNELSLKYENFFHLKGLSDKKYRENGFINRIRNRIYIFLYYPLKTIFFSLKLSEFDKIIVVPSPFFIPLILSLIFRKKLVIIQTDLYPEGFKSIPILKKMIFIHNLYKRLSDNFYKENLNLFISKNLMNSRNYPKSRVVYTPSVDRYFFQSPKDSKSIGYLGTLGHNHYGIEFLEMLNNSSFEEEVEFSFNISGSLVESFKKKSQQLKSIKNLKNLFIDGPLDEISFQKKMNTLGFGLVLMGKSASNTLFPSKFSGHIAAGHPIILISDQKNEIHEFIENKKIGLSIHHDDGNLNKLNGFLKNNNLDEIKSNALQVFKENFDHKVVAEKLFSIIN
tara:strand:- start:4327 stop:5388 length:1062 start_codon:yes stop_codon:yes gene_type:complete